MKTLKLHRSRDGSVFVTVLFIITVLTILGGIAVMQVMNHRTTMNQAGVWQEALVAADAGIQQAVAQLELGLKNNIAFTGTTSTTSTTGTTLTLTKNSSNVVEGPSTTTAAYTITRYLVTMSGSNVLPYYLVSSTGTVVIPMNANVISNASDTVLRKFTYGYSAAPGRPNSVLVTGTAVRVLKTWIKPRLNTDAAIAAVKSLDFNNHNVTVAGFNSSDSSMSGTATVSLSGTTYTMTGQPPPVSNPGLYSPPYLASVATDGSVADAGSATIYGDASTNGGSTLNTNNVYGEVRNDYSQTFEPVYAPSWPTGTFHDGLVINRSHGSPTTLTTLNTSGTFTGGTKDSPEKYKLTAVSLSGASDVVLFTFGTQGVGASSAPDPNKNYIELYVTGDIKTKGGGTTDGSIIISNGVNVKIYAGGDVAFGGNGLANYNGKASSLAIYGINAPTNPNASYSFGGTSDFFGTVYAPGASITLQGTSRYIGSIVGQDVYAGGTVNVFYDESLATSGTIIGFAMGTWLE